MQFKSLKNIESSFRQLRLFGIVYLCACTLLVGYSVWKAYRFAEAQRQKIYVLDEGKSLMLALAQDLSQNRPVEAREHVKRFTLRSRFSTTRKDSRMKPCGLLSLLVEFISRPRVTRERSVTLFSRMIERRE